MAELCVRPYNHDHDIYIIKSITITIQASTCIIMGSVIKYRVFNITSAKLKTCIIIITMLA